MATNTPNYSFKKPGYTDPVDINDINGNFDKVDEELKAQSDKIGISSKNMDGRAINVMYPPVPLVAAKGDDVTDDVTAINGIINHLYLNGGGVVLLPPATYRIKGMITLKDGVSVIGGENRNNSVNFGTVINYEGTGTAIKCYTYDASASIGNVASYSNIILKGFFLNDVNNTGDIGLDLHGFRWSQLENVSIKGFNKGLHTWHCYYANFKNILTVNYRTNGIHAESQDNNSTWDKIKISSALNIGVSKAAIFGYAYNIVFENLSCETNTLTGVSIENCRAVTINGMYFEAFGTGLTSGLTFISTKGATVIGAEMQGNSNTNRAIFGYGSDHIIIMGGSIRGFTGDPIVNTSVTTGDNRNFFVHNVQIDETANGEQAKMLASGVGGGQKIGWRYVNWTQYDGAPTSGTWNRGDVVFKKTATAGSPMGWVCTTAGTPGTWQAFGTVEGAALGFRAYSNTNQSLAAATLSKLNFDTESYDDNAEYDPTTSRFTAKKTGVYSIKTSFKITTVADANRVILSIQKNGAEVERVYDAFTAASGALIVSGFTHLKLNANDYVEIHAFSTNEVTIEAGSQHTNFSVQKI